jgi:hypothetical protein
MHVVSSTVELLIKVGSIYPVLKARKLFIPDFQPSCHTLLGPLFVPSGLVAKATTVHRVKGMGLGVYTLLFDVVTQATAFKVVVMHSPVCSHYYLTRYLNC